MKPLALVIENDSGTRKLLNVLLARAGFEVDAVATGASALLLLEQVEYDVVFLDLLMPGVSGADILDWVSRERPAEMARVVVLSSAAPAQLQLLRNDWPAMHVFRKPFELEEVIDAARQVSGSESRRKPPTFAEQFIRRSVRAGAKSGVVVQTNGTLAEAIVDFGQRELTATYFPLPIASASPLASSIRDARSVWLTSARVATIEYPLLEPVFTTTESRAWAAVPLIRGGEVIGAAGWTFREPRQFTEPEQEVFAAIAETIVEWMPIAGATRA